MVNIFFNYTKNKSKFLRFYFISIMSDRPEDSLLNIIASGVLDCIYTCFLHGKIQIETKQRKDCFFCFVYCILNAFALFRYC